MLETALRDFDHPGRLICNKRITTNVTWRATTEGCRWNPRGVAMLIIAKRIFLVFEFTLDTAQTLANKVHFIVYTNETRIVVQSKTRSRRTEWKLYIFSSIVYRLHARDVDTSSCNCKRE